jgi:Rad3-related DNA helicase
MKHLDLMGAFPFNRYPHMRVAQKNTFEFLEPVQGVAVVELPVGSGKTAIGYTYLEALRREGATNLFYLAPNKTQVEQVHSLHPDMQVVYGRNEHPCLYYEDKDLRADDIPCSMLTDCAHRVNQESGKTHTPGATPCSYLLQKYQAKHSGKAIVCTNAFFLFTVMFSKEFNPEGVVIDEVQGLAQSIRQVLSTELTDWKLAKAIDALNAVGSKEVHNLSAFLQQMKRLVKGRAMNRDVLLEEEEIEKLHTSLGKVRADTLESDARSALKRGDLDADDDREVLKQIEDIARSVRRFRHALGFAMEGSTKWGYPLNFVIAYGKSEMGERDRVQFKVTVKDYYVVPIIKKLLPTRTLAYSATISDPDILSFETGIKGEYKSIPSDFPVKNARIYMPTDTPNLAVKARNRQDKTKSLRMIAKTAKKFAARGHRSLVIVVSNEEREKFLMLAAEEGLNVISYDADCPPRECATRFKGGEGDAMVGTVSNFGEGLDLPKQIAPVIFYYRPGYPRPDDPQTQFEERRFGNRRWASWNWRVIVSLLQVRGRNIRSKSDIGVTFLISQQFRRFAYGSLPEWLRPAYNGKDTMEDCVKDAMKLLS